METYTHRHPYSQRPILVEIHRESHRPVPRRVLALRLCVGVRFVNISAPTARPNSYLRVRTSGAVSVQAGIAATLECSYACGATHVQDTVVEWWRIRVPTSEKILVMDGSPHLYHLRAEWIGDTGTCNASIALRDVQENDTGSYLCDVLLLPAYNEGRDLLTLVVAGNSGERPSRNGIGRPATLPSADLPPTPSGRDEEDPSRVISITAGAICVGLVVVIAAIIIAAVYFLKNDNQRSEEAMPLQDANTEMATAQPQQDVASAEDEGDDEDDDDDDD
ncbi:uncharacterized protein LOC142907751 [Petromyzon marinus]|uniref:uncharacterized protein LOC142907751 n=1 Tax=Petromyzon marinus TaxID=7757 RepID=UPI003F726005